MVSGPAFFVVGRRVVIFVTTCDSGDDVCRRRSPRKMSAPSADFRDGGNEPTSRMVPEGGCTLSDTDSGRACSELGCENATETERRLERRSQSRNGAVAVRNAVAGMVTAMCAEMTAYVRW